MKSWLFEVAFDEGILERHKGPVGDGLARIAHEAQIEMQIMERKQP
jgi:hypothetical protein